MPKMSFCPKFQSGANELPPNHLKAVPWYYVVWHFVTLGKMTFWVFCHLGHNVFWAFCHLGHFVILGQNVIWAFLTLGILLYLGILSPWALYHTILLD